MLKRSPQFGLLTLIFFGTTLGGFSLAAYFYQRWEAQKNENATLVAAMKSDRAKTSGRKGAPKDQPAAAGASAAETSSQGETKSEGESTSAARDDNSPRREGGSRAAAIRELMSNPDVIKLMTLQQKGELDGRYADLFKKLNLPPATLDQLKTLLVERQNISRDVFSAARQEGMGLDNRDEIEALIKVSRDENAAQIRALLGEAAYKEYESYNQNASERKLVGQIDDRLSYTAAPLSDQQSYQLEALLAQASQQTQPAAGENTNAPRLLAGLRESGRLGFGDSANSPRITDQVINQASTFLSPPQVAALRQIQAEQQAQLQLRQTFSEAAAKTGAATRSKNASR